MINYTTYFNAFFLFILISTKKVIKILYIFLGIVLNLEIYLLIQWLLFN